MYNRIEISIIHMRCTESLVYFLGKFWCQIDNAKVKHLIYFQSQGQMQMQLLRSLMKVNFDIVTRRPYMVCVFDI